MDELTFLLILSGIGVILLIAMFTYYRHHKKIHDEIQDFNHHNQAMDDVLLQNHEHQTYGHDQPDHAQLDSFTQKKDSPEQDLKQPGDSSLSGNELEHSDMPGSFSASRKDNFDIDNVRINNEAINKNDHLNESELVDGVYINTKRVIHSHNSSYKPLSSFKKTTDTFNSYIQSKDETSEYEDKVQPSESKEYKPEIEEHKPVESEPVKSQPVETEHKHNVQAGLQKVSIVYDPVPEGVEELIISHTILAKENYFPGEKLFHVLDAAGLSFGEMNIFHFPGDNKPETFALFSIANAVEPGIFDLDDAKTFSTPGISMFMRLPTRIDNYKAYEEFIRVANFIASELGGELCDESRNQLTQQAISYKQEQIKKLNFSMAKAKKLAGMN